MYAGGGPGRVPERESLAVSLYPTVSNISAAAGAELWIWEGPEILLYIHWRHVAAAAKAETSAAAGDTAAAAAAPMRPAAAAAARSRRRQFITVSLQRAA